MDGKQEPRNGATLPLRPTTYKTIFLDVGSTLLELTQTWEKVYHQVFQRAGYEIELGEVEQAVAYSWGIVSQQDPTAFFENTLNGSRRWQQEIEQRVMERLGIHPNIQEELFWKIIEAFENPQSYYVFPETIPTLTRLKAEGYRLGIISNWSWNLPDLCEHHGLAKYFDQIVTSARIGCSKPNKVIFQTALQQMQADPATSLHIGDTFRADVLGAASVGMAALWLDKRNEAARFEKIAPLTELQKNIRITSLDQIWSFLEKPVEQLSVTEALNQLNSERQVGQ